MSKPDWGIKRVCNNGTCGTKFYDFHEKTITCPQCGGVYSQKLSSRSFIEDRLVPSEEPLDQAAPLDESENIDSDTPDGESSEEAVSLEDADDLT